MTNLIILSPCGVLFTGCFHFQFDYQFDYQFYCHYLHPSSNIENTFTVRVTEKKNFGGSIINL